MTLLVRIALILMLVPTMALAQLPDQFKLDFAPIEGTIIMPAGDAYLVDIDAQQNLRQGDLLSLVVPGDSIIHPVTKDIVGTIDEIAGFLQVTRIMSGYSYVTPLTEGLAVKPGDRVRRFDQVPARLDASIPPDLATTLKNNLPHLLWVATTEQGNPATLNFSIDFERLVIADADGTSLHSYRYSGGRVFALSAPTSSPVETPQPPIRSDDEGEEGEEEEGSFLTWGFRSAMDTVGLGRDKRLEAPGIVRGHQSGDFWMSPPLSDTPVAMATGDLTGDGRREIVLALRDELQILRLDAGKMKELYQMSFPVGTQLLSVDTYDLNRNGQDEIVLTTITGTSLNSLVLAIQNGQLQTMITNIDWFLRVTELPGEGQVLLGQRANYNDGTFRAPVFRVELENNQPVRGQDLVLPRGVDLYNFLVSGEAQEEQFLVVLSDADYLHLMDLNGEPLWSSTDHFGGTSASYSVLPRREAQEREPQFLQKRILRLPTGEIVTIQNEGQRLLTGLRLFTDSRLVAFGRDGTSLKELWATPTQKGYMADFAVADVDGDGTTELIMTMRFQARNLIQRGHSALLVYKLQQ